MESSPAAVSPTTASSPPSWRQALAAALSVRPEVPAWQAAVAFLVSSVVGAAAWLLEFPLLAAAAVAAGLPVAIFLVLAVHEYAHAAAAVRAGGRVNSIRISLMGGVTFVWYPDDAPFAHRLAIPAAGLAASLLAALAAVPFALLAAHFSPAWAAPLWFWVAANGSLFAMNALPVAGFDGYSVIATLLREASHHQHLSDRTTTVVLAVLPVLVLASVAVWAFRTSSWVAWVLSAGFAVMAVWPHLLRRRYGTDRP